MILVNIRLTYQDIENYRFRNNIYTNKPMSKKGFLNVHSRANKRRTTMQNTYFTERFGRNDFSIINDPLQTQYAVKYIVKYLEKSGERIVYSKGLYQYFISDIMDEDILCPYYAEDEKHYADKYILFDKFRCWDEGLYMGDVCPETIAKMRKSN